MIVHTFPHPAPNMTRIAEAVQPLVAPAGVSLWRTPTGVGIGLVTWAGVDEVAVATAVANTPSDTPTLQDQVAVDTLPHVLKAALLTLLDLINLDRQARGAAAITPAQYIAAVKAKL